MKTLPLVPALAVLAFVLSGCPLATPIQPPAPASTNPPSAPTGLSAVSQMSCAATLSWTDASSDETGFKVYQSLASGSGYTLTKTLAAGETTCECFGLAPGATHYFRVTAYNTAGESAPADASCPTVAFSGDTIFMTGITFNGQTLALADPVLNVAPGAAITGQISMSVHNSNAANDIFPIGLAPTWGDRKSNYVAVSAHQPPGNASYTFDLSLLAPSTVGTYSLVAVCAPELDVGDIMSCTNWFYGPEKWDDGNDVADTAQEYLQYSVSHGFTLFKVLFNGGAYQWAERGASAIKVVVAQPQGPVVPTGLRVTGITTTSVSLAWDATAGATGYNVRRDTSPTGSFADVVPSGAAPSCTDGGRSPGTTYYYKVQAFNGSGSSPFTDPVGATTASGNGSILVPGTYGTLQQAMSAAGSGDTIEVTGGPYTLAADFTIKSGVTLVLNPGVQINGGDRIIYVSGTLNASGATFTDIAWVYFQSTGGGTVSGCTFADTNNTNDSYALFLEAGATPNLSANTITGYDTDRVALGGSVSRNWSLPKYDRSYFLNSALSVSSGSTLSFASGVTIDGNNMTIIVYGTLNASGVTFSNIAALDFQSTGGGTVTGCTFVDTDNTSDTYALFLEAGSTPILSSNTITDYDTDKIALGGSVSRNWSLPKYDRSYYLNSALSVSSGSTLSFASGVTIDGNNMTIIVYGTLNASGVTFSNIAALDFQSTGGGTVTGCTLVDTDNTSDTYAIFLEAGTTPNLSADTISGYDTDKIALGGAMSTNWSLPKYDRDYYLNSGLSVSSGFTLSFASGVTIDGNNMTISVSGTLNANGVTFSNIAALYFQSTGGGTVMGCTLTDTDNTSDTYAIFLEAGATPNLSANTITDYDTVRIALGGSVGRNWSLPKYDRDYYLNSGLSVSSGFTLSFASGVSIDGNNMTISVSGTLNAGGVTFSNIAALYFQSTGGGTVTGCTLTDTDNTSDSYAIFLDGGSVPDLSGNTITDYDTAKIALGGSVGRNWSLPKYDRDYYLNSGLSVSSGFTLSFASGVTVDGNNMTISVSGTLNAGGVTFSNIAVLYFQSTGGGTVTGCTLTDTDNTSDSYAVFLEGGSTPSLSTNTITGYATDKIALNGSVSRNWALPKYDKDFSLYGNLSVTSGYTLSIASGVAIDGNNKIITVYGTLSGNTVTFANLGYVSFQSTGGGSLTNCTLTDTDNLVESYAIFLEGGSVPELSDNSIIGYATDKIALSGSVGRNWALPKYDKDFSLYGNLSVTAGYTLSIASGAAFEGNNKTITVYGTFSANGATFTNLGYVSFQSTGGGSLTNCTLTDTDNLTEDYAIFLEGGSVPELSGNTITDYATDKIALSGSVGRNWALPKYDKDFSLYGNLSVTAGYTLSIASGAAFEGNNKTITVYGNLTVTGAAFTNIGGIIFRSTGSGTVSSCSLTDTDNVSDANAIYIYAGSTPTISGNSFSGFVADVVYQ
jgi:hypothetical protein